MSDFEPKEQKPLVVKKDKLTFLSSIPEIFKMLKSSFSKEYPNFPVYTFLGIIVMAAYLIFPADLIPDFIPFLGIVDDATILAFFVFLAQNDVEKFHSWKNSVSKVEKVEVVEEEKPKKEEVKKEETIQEENTEEKE
jgi:uncharacterized membrane protein YkvA (DUF1232 family)